jgi:DNA-directed RNA polymerase subunit F
VSRKILSEKPISLERVKDLLKFRGEQADLNYIQRVTYEYASKFSKHFPGSEEILDTLNLKYEISREKGIQLININPKNIDEISLVLEDKVSDEVKKEILNLFLEHLSLYEIVEQEESVDLPSTDESDENQENK